LAQQSGLNKLETHRAEKLSRIRQLGFDPYGQRYDNAESAVGIKDRFIDDKPDQTARTAGRIVLLRDIGKLIFITLRYPSRFFPVSS